MQEHSDFELISASPFWMERSDSKTPLSERRYHYHDCYQLYYLFSGELYYFINDRTYLVKPGNIVLINEYDIHCTVHSSMKHYDRIVIDFKKEFFEDFLSLCTDIDLFSSFRRDIHLIRLSPQDQNSVEALLLAMQSEYKKNLPGKLSLTKAQLIQLLTFISRQSGSCDEEENYVNSAHKTISEITAYINNNYRSELTLTRLSEIFYISPYYLSRIFGEITGISFTEYLNGVRIKEAKKLLITTALSVSVIAEAVGYRSCTHFGRVFKEITHYTPTEYRRKHPRKL